MVRRISEPTSQRRKCSGLLAVSASLARKVIARAHCTLQRRKSLASLTVTAPVAITTAARGPGSAFWFGALGAQNPKNRLNPTERSRPGTLRAPESNTRTRTMFAVIKTGGKQYRVAAEDVLQIDKDKGDPGEIIQFGEVLLLGGDEVKLGLPTVAGASVAAEVLEQGRGPKIIAFKKRRPKNSRRKSGHRQEFTLVRVTEILTDGAKPTKSAAPKAARPKAAKPESAEPESAESKSAKAGSTKSKAAKPKAAKPKAAKPKRGAAP